MTKQATQNLFSIVVSLIAIGLSIATFRQNAKNRAMRAETKLILEQINQPAKQHEKTNES